MRRVGRGIEERGGEQPNFGLVSKLLAWTHNTATFASCSLPNAIPDSQFSNVNNEQLDLTFRTFTIELARNW